MGRADVPPRIARDVVHVHVATALRAVVAVAANDSHRDGRAERQHPKA